MRFLAGLLLTLAVAATPAEAGVFSWLFGNGDKLPRPIDSPIVRPKVREHHKVGKRAGRHPSRLADADYGTEWDRTLKIRRAHRAQPWVYRTGIE